MYSFEIKSFVSTLFANLLLMFKNVGWLFVLGLTAFETVFQSISGHVQERKGEKREK